MAKASKKRLRPQKTVLDSELTFLSDSVRRDGLRRSPIQLSAAVAKGMKQGLSADADESTDADEKVTIKLISRAGRKSDLARWVEKQGGVISSQSQEGAVLLANLPKTVVARLDRLKSVLRAEASRVLLPRLDQARGEASNLEQALQTHALSGQGVVFGIVDSGLDWRHPDFRSENGATRLELFTHAFQPEGSDVSQFDDFDRAAIDAALQDQGQVAQGDPHGHGTHCASIAVGNGLGSDGVFRGVAPNAAIVAMRSEPLLDTHTIRGIRECFRLAGDRPAVVSLSLGGHIGPHDGTSALENVIARESGPGRIVVVAAGNEGSDGIHWQGGLIENETLTIPIRIADPDLQVIDVWIARGDEVDIAIESPDGALFDPDGDIHSSVFGDFRADWRQDSINQEQNLTLLLVASQNFTWRIRITPRRVLNGQVHAWGHTVSPSNASNLFPGFTDPAYSIGMPATEERAIAVGSFISKTRFDTKNGTLVAQALNEGQLSPFSSHGPTRIGIQKPDIAAPGQYITAALAENSVFTSSTAYIPRHHPTQGYITIQGTSMATPFVAGVIALLLEREPELTPEEVQQRLRITARRDNDTGRVWNPGFGYGKLDVEALLDYVG